MKILITIFTILVSFAASAQKKYTRDTIWYPSQDTSHVTVPVELTNGKIVNMIAVYQHGRNVAGKDQPRIIGYLQPNKRRLTASQKPKKIRWDRVGKN